MQDHTGIIAGQENATRRSDTPIHIYESELAGSGAGSAILGHSQGSVHSQTPA